MGGRGVRRDVFFEQWVRLLILAAEIDPETVFWVVGLGVVSAAQGAISLSPAQMRVTAPAGPSPSATAKLAK